MWVTVFSKRHTLIFADISTDNRELPQFTISARRFRDDIVAESAGQDQRLSRGGHGRDAVSALEVALFSICNEKSVFSCCIFMYIVK